MPIKTIKRKAVRILADAIFVLKKDALLDDKITFLVFTGTAGKTTFRDAVAMALKKSGHEVESNDLGYSNELGVLLTALGIYNFSPYNPKSWIAVLRNKPAGEKIVCVELGADFCRDIPWFLKKFRPAAVFISEIAGYPWVNNGEKIAVERTMLLEAVPESGAVIYNIDSAPVRNLVDKSRIRARKISLSLENKDSDFFADWGKNIYCRDASDIPKNKESVVIVRKNKAVKIDFDRFLFKPQVLAVAAAVGFVETFFHISEGSWNDIFSGYRFSKLRLQAFRSKTGFMIIEDSYKAIPLCTDWFLETAGQVRAEKKALIITEMRPTPIDAAKFYSDIAEKMIWFDAIYFIGPSDKYDLLKKGGLQIECVRKKDYLTVSGEIKRRYGTGDVVFIKGHYGHDLDRLRDLLLQ